MEHNNEKVVNKQFLIKFLEKQQFFNIFHLRGRQRFFGQSFINKFESLIKT
jgi:hypothetical protein